MPYEYKILVRSSPSAEEIRLEVKIGRSEDSGDTFAEIASFRSRHNLAAADSVIIATVDRKVTEFVKADSDRIDTKLVDERAAAIVEALDGRSYIP